MTAKVSTDTIQLPSCPDSERALIAAVIEAGTVESTFGAVDVVTLSGGTSLTPCFESEKHRRVWALLCERHAAGLPNGLVEVAEACREKGTWLAEHDIGSDLMKWVLALDENFIRGQVSPLGYAAHNAREVRETAERRRKILQTYELLQRLATDRSPISTWLPGTAEDIGQTSPDANESATPIAKHLDATMAHVAALANGRLPDVSGISTGLAGLDNLLGGLRPGRVTLVAGRTSQGKSALAVSIALAAAQAGVRVVYVSLEMRGSELSERMLAQISGMPAVRLWRGPLGISDLPQVSRGAQILAGLDVRTIDDEDNWPTLAARLHREIALGAGLVVIDYLQLVKIRGERLDDWQRLGRVSSEIKGLALRANIPVLSVAQLNRESAKEQKPKLHHLRGSGDLEQDADAVVLIHREAGPDGKPVGDRAELCLEKNRGGPTGNVMATWDGPLMRFTDFAPRLDYREDD